MFIKSKSERITRSRDIKNNNFENSIINFFIFLFSPNLLNHKKKAKNPDINPVYKIKELLREKNFRSKTERTIKTIDIDKKNGIKKFKTLSRRSDAKCWYLQK